MYGVVLGSITKLKANSYGSLGLRQLLRPRHPLSLPYPTTADLLLAGVVQPKSHELQLTVLLRPIKGILCKYFRRSRNSTPI